MSDLGFQFENPDSKSIFNDDTELKIIRNLLKDHIKSNRQLEEKNLSLTSCNVILENKCEELNARLGLMNKETTSKNIELGSSEFDISLEHEMLKARISSSVLKSIVTPLENEITFLKKRLKEVESCLYVSSYKPVKVLPEISIDIVSNGELNSIDSACISNKITDNELTELKKRLEAAELFVLSLIRKNNELEEKNKRLEISLNDINKMFEIEKTAHDDLKSTWQKANEQFILQSLNLQNEIQKLNETQKIRSSSHSISETHPNETILMQAEIARLKQELSFEKNKINDLNIAVKIFNEDIRDQMAKSESDCTSLDAILFSIQEEMVRRDAGKL